MKTTQDRIDEIMDNFDFKKVEQTMKALDWKWGMADSIPEEYELRREARRLLKDVASENVRESDLRYAVATGGFKATKYFDGGLELEFIVTSWDTNE